MSRWVLWQHECKKWKTRFMLGQRKSKDVTDVCYHICDILASVSLRRTTRPKFNPAEVRAIVRQIMTEYFKPLSHRGLNVVLAYHVDFKFFKTHLASALQCCSFSVCAFVVAFYCSAVVSLLYAIHTSIQYFKNYTRQSLFR